MFRRFSAAVATSREGDRKRQSAPDPAATGPGTVTPESEKAALNVGGVAPPTMSVPTRSQSGSEDR
jgi:hypothetical protein